MVGRKGRAGRVETQVANDGWQVSTQPTDKPGRPPALAGILPRYWQRAVGKEHLTTLLDGKERGTQARVDGAEHPRYLHLSTGTDKYLGR